MVKVDRDAAKRALSDVSPECCFWVSNGPVLKNLDELCRALPKMKKETFAHHLNKEKNDFSRWVEDVLGDKGLADQLKAVKTKQGAIKAIGQRLQMLKRIAINNKN